MSTYDTQIETARIHQLADAAELAESWLNGNLGDVRAALERVPSLKAAALTAGILIHLESHPDEEYPPAHSFRVAVQKWGVMTRFRRTWGGSG